MQNFWDPNEQAEVLIPMYGNIHLIALAFLLLIIPLLIWKRENIKRWVQNRKLVRTFIWSFFAVEALYWTMIWYFQYEPMYERFPFHMCGSMALVIPILILTKQHKALLYFTFWAVPAGFISLVNPGFIHDDPWSFAFIQYLIRHFTIFSLPFIMFIGFEYKLSYKFFLKSLLGFAGYAVLIFFINWATGSNFLHLGQNNPLAIPFLPESFTVWPWSLPGFSMVGVIVLHLFYLVFKRIERMHVVPA